MVNSNLSILRRCNKFLLEHITQLERNNLNNAKYNRRETIEINAVSLDNANNVLEKSVCQASCLAYITSLPLIFSSKPNVTSNERLNTKMFLIT